MVPLVSFTCIGFSTGDALRDVVKENTKEQMSDIISSFSQLASWFVIGDYLYSPRMDRSCEGI